MRLVFLLSLFAFSFSSVAQDASDDTEAPTTDEVFEYTQEESGEEEVFVQKIDPDQVRSVSDYRKEKIFHRAFDENQRRKIIGDKDYSENHPEPEPEEETTPDEVPVPRGIWNFEWLKIVAYAVIAGIVLLIVFLVIQNLRIPRKIKQTPTSGFKAESFEDIQELDIDTMLNKAMADADYKLAIRLYYLMLLRNLQNAGLIKWEKDKTNRDYINELYNSTAYYADVRSLTRSYEEVWYGEHVIPEPTLLTVISSFKAINSKLNPGKDL